MIKINLGRKRKPSGTGKIDLNNLSVSSLVDIFKNMGGSKGAQKFDYRNSGLVKVILIALAVYLADDYFKQLQREELAKVGAQITKVQNEINQVQVELNKLSEIEAVREQLEGDEKLLMIKLETLTKLMQGRVVPAKMMLEFSKMMPQELWLTSMQSKDVNFIMEGESSSIDQISDLIGSINQSNYLMNPEFQKTEEKGTAGKEMLYQKFTLSAKRKVL